jgi:hypothetical protein
MYLLRSLFAVNLDDLHMFDPAAMEWTQIGSSDVLGAWPSARRDFGLTTVNGILYIFGGLGDFGELQ